MTSYEVWSLCISVAAFGAALVANVRSWKAVKAAEAANRIARAQNDEVKAANCPQLVFTCDTENPDFNFFIIRVKVSNSGNHVTEIVKGQIALHSDKYPEAEKPYELTGKKIASGVPYTAEFKIKRAVVYGSGPGVKPAEIRCHAIYTRPEREHGEEKATYKYDPQKRKFI